MTGFSAFYSVHVEQLHAFAFLRVQNVPVDLRSYNEMRVSFFSSLPRKEIVAAEPADTAVVIGKSWSRC